MGGDDQFVKAEFDNQWYVRFLGSRVGRQHGNRRRGRPDTQSIEYPLLRVLLHGRCGNVAGHCVARLRRTKVGPQVYVPETGETFAAGGKALFKQSFELRYP